MGKNQPGFDVRHLWGIGYSQSPPKVGARKIACGLVLDVDQVQPLRGAVGPATRRSAARRISPGQLSGRLPRPTSTSVPTIARTMLYRNPSASISMRDEVAGIGIAGFPRPKSRGVSRAHSSNPQSLIPSPCFSPCPALPRSTEMSKIVRTLVFRLAPLLSKLLKSCVPSSAAAAPLHGVGVEPAVSVMPREMPAKRHRGPGRRGSRSDSVCGRRRRWGEIRRPLRPRRARRCRAADWR